MMHQYFTVKWQYCIIAVKDSCNVYAIFMCCMGYMPFNSYFRTWLSSLGHSVRTVDPSSCHLWNV